MKILSTMIAVCFTTALFGIVVLICQCNVEPKRLSADHVQKFASRVRCAKGAYDRCWCVIATRKTGEIESKGIGMTLAPDDLCQKEENP